MTRLERIARARLESMGFNPDTPMGDARGNVEPAWKQTENLGEARRFEMMFEAAMGKEG